MAGDKADRQVSPAEAQNSGPAHETHREDKTRPAKAGDAAPGKDEPRSPVRPGGEAESRDDL